MSLCGGCLNPLNICDCEPDGFAADVPTQKIYDADQVKVTFGSVEIKGFADGVFINAESPPRKCAHCFRPTKAHCVRCFVPLCIICAWMVPDHAGGSIYCRDCRDESFRRSKSG